ncbi:MAG: SH3 domain-containing protein [Desulfatiglandaceae bacterium]
MRNTPLWILALMFSGMFFLVDVGKAQEDWEALFFESNQAYADGDFEAAIRGYRQLIRSGYAYGQIYYNLGNAYLRTDALGRAIWAYERARVVMPRDADLNYNLAHVRDQTVDAIPETRGLADTAFFWLDHVTLTEVFRGFAVLNLFFWTVLLIRLFKRTEWLYYMLILLIPLWGIAAGSFGVKWHQLKNDDRAIIVAKSANVLAGPQPSDTVLFKLHEGAMVTVERSENGWRLIQLSDEKRGWVKRKTLQLLSTPIAPKPMGANGAQRFQPPTRQRSTFSQASFLTHRYFS